MQNSETFFATHPTLPPLTKHPIFHVPSRSRSPPLYNAQNTCKTKPRTKYRRKVITQINTSRHKTTQLKSQRETPQKLQLKNKKEENRKNSKFSTVHAKTTWSFSRRRWDHHRREKPEKLRAAFAFHVRGELSTPTTRWCRARPGGQLVTHTVWLMGAKSFKIETAKFWGYF